MSLTFVTVVFPNLSKTSYSRKSVIKYEVPQGSLLGPLLFNIDLTDLFFECNNSEIASYADDTTPYSCTDDIPSVFTQLLSTSRELASWFTNNGINVNPEKCHALLSTKNSIDVNIEGACFTSSSCEKLPGITIDFDLKFDNIFLTYAKKLAKKLNVLCQITGYMSLETRKILIKMFVES